MKGAPFSLAEVTRVFEIPGRIRCFVPGLAGSPQQAARIQEALRGMDGVQEATASPVSGRVLVVFDESIAPDEMHREVARLRQRYLATPRNAAVPAPAPHPLKQYAADAAWGAAAGVSIAAMGGGLALAIAGGLATFLVPILWRRVQQHFTPPLRVVRSNLIRMPSRARLESLAPVIEPYRREFVRAIALNIVGAIAGIFRIAAMAFTIDLLLGGSISLPFGWVLAGMSGAAILTAAALGLTALQAWIRHRSHVVWSATGRQIQHDLRVRCYDRVQRLEMSSLQMRQRGDLLSTLVEDIDNLDKAIEALWALMDLALSSAALLVAIGFIAVTAPLWLLIPVPILIALSVYLYPKLRKWYARVRQRSAQLAGQLSNQLDGVEIIKSFAAEDLELQRTRQSSQAYRDESSGAVHMQSGLPLILEGTILASLVFTYRTNVMLTLAKGMSLGRFMALNIFTGHLVFPLNALGLHLDNLSQGLEALDRVREALELPDEFRDDLSLARPPRHSFGSDIHYEHITFSYPSGNAALRNVSLSFVAGKTTAVVGLSGSGKTTLIKLLLRLYPMDSGSIVIGDTDISAVSRTTLRRAIAVVSQDVYLFNRSVLDNIRLSRPDATEAEAVEAAKIAQAHDFILRLPEAYQTKLGERGQGLSTGERQRISIARAVLKDAPILVLDEATSNLDSNTEAAISRKLRHIAAGRTVILIAHRLATVRHADRIYALEDGEVIAHGTHTELVRRPGRYQALWRDQTGRT
jgi:ATP-binding cassette, subfamily B, bacterial